MIVMEVEVPNYEVKSSLDVSKDDSVLLVVDMQNDFAHEDGTLYNPEARESIPVIQKLVTKARKSDVPVWFTKDTHVKNDPEFKIWGEHCLRGSEGWKIVEELQPREQNRVFEKSRYDGFYGTELDHQMTIHDRDTLVIVGTVANICVHYTAASAGLRYYNVIHPVDGISALTEFDYHATLRQSTFLFQAQLVVGENLNFD